MSPSSDSLHPAVLAFWVFGTDENIVMTSASTENRYSLRNVSVFVEPANVPTRWNVLMAATFDRSDSGAAVSVVSVRAFTGSDVGNSVINQPTSQTSDVSKSRLQPAIRAQVVNCASISRTFNSSNALTGQHNPHHLYGPHATQTKQKNKPSAWRVKWHGPEFPSFGG